LKYSELVDEHDGERRLIIPSPAGPMKIVFNAYNEIASLLDQLPTVKVCIDNGPPNAGPASGPTYVFFIADGVSKAEPKESIAALATALKSGVARR
jgi:hypothetical protein